MGCLKKSSKFGIPEAFLIVLVSFTEAKSSELWRNQDKNHCLYGFTKQNILVYLPVSKLPDDTADDFC